MFDPWETEPMMVYIWNRDCTLWVMDLSLLID